MGCNCSKNDSQPKAVTYTVTAPNGQKSSYRTEVEAAAAARRVGGTYK